MKYLVALVLLMFASPAFAASDEDIQAQADLCRAHRRPAVAKGVTIFQEEWDAGWEEPCKLVIKKAEQIRDDKYLKVRSAKDADDLAKVKATAKQVTK